MSMIGMDIGQVRTLAAQMDDCAGQITDIIQRLTGQLGNTPWQGPDATNFRDGWQSQHVPALNNVVNGLRDACDRARRNADEQERASA